jgi:O-acetyl-ADP-ribose deacetylase (regulator of RNase III)
LLKTQRRRVAVIVTERVGNLFDYAGFAIGHGVNCQGLMGAGIALEFRKRWPEMYEEYKVMCDSGELQPGGFFGWLHQPELYEGFSGEGTLVVNLATQQRPGRDARLRWVVSSLNQAATVLQRHYDTNELAIPRVGCGIGGLHWEQVKAALSFEAPNDFEVIAYSLEEE